ncbi:MAG: hypothetical protein C0603_00110 [Denitrovibrio sp.]|nr:MAG: hypothetical protein C0603_00110 [Denitrovibrio sp.]
MDITVLGSGSAIQFEERASASFLIEANGKKILLDAGFHLLDRLEKNGIMADEIDAVYISHKHPDHFFGLLHLLFALKNRYYSPKEKLHIFGFKGLEAWIRSFQKLMGRWLEPNIELIFSEDTKGEFDEIKWQTFKTVHSPESTGIVLESKGKKIVYSGDTEMFDKLINIVNLADVFIAECGSGNNKKIKGHMCLNDILYITESAKVARVLLTHIYPETDQTDAEWKHGATLFTRSYDHYKISL